MDLIFGQEVSSVLSLGWCVLEKKIIDLVGLLNKKYNSRDILPKSLCKSQTVDYKAVLLCLYGLNNCKDFSKLCIYIYHIIISIKLYFILFGGIVLVMDNEEI